MDRRQSVAVVDARRVRPDCNVRLRRYDPGDRTNNARRHSRDRREDSPKHLRHGPRRPGPTLRWPTGRDEYPARHGEPLAGARSVSAGETPPVAEVIRWIAALGGHTGIVKTDAADKGTPRARPCRRRCSGPRRTTRAEGRERPGPPRGCSVAGRDAWHGRCRSLSWCRRHVALVREDRESRSLCGCRHAPDRQISTLDNEQSKVRVVAIYPARRRGVVGQRASLNGQCNERRARGSLRMTGNVHPTRRPSKGSLLDLTGDDMPV